jgi:hypothetical protein
MTGLAIGVVVVAVFLFGPKSRPEERVAEHIAVLAREPWDSVRVSSIQFQGPAGDPTDVFVRGLRPNGTPVLVQFAADSPYASATAVRRILETPPENRDAEILMVPRSLVLSKFRDRFRADVTHAGVAFFAGAPPAPQEAQRELTPADTTAPSDS